MGMAFADELVFKVLDDVAAFTVQLQHAASAPDHVHGLADVVIVAHAAGALFVGHEHLERLDAEVDGIGEAGQDAGPVLQDEMEGKVREGALLDGLAGAVRGLGQGLVAVELVGAEGDQRGEAGMGGGEGTQGIVIMAVEVDVAVDEAGEDELAGGVDVVVGGREVRLGADGDDFFAGDGDGALVHLG